MADNLEANPGTGGATFATDEIGGVHYPRAKQVFGVDGVATDVSASDPLPVTDAAVATAVAAVEAALGGTLTVDGTVAVTGVATEATLASLLTSSQLIDDAIVADDAAFTPATTKVMMAGFEFDDTTPDSVNEGDAGAARMSANRNVYVQIRDAAGNERGLAVDASNRIAVTVATLPASTNTIEVVGDAAAGATIAGNPVRIGAHARSADVGAVSSGQMASCITDLVGKLIVLPYGIPEVSWQAVTSAKTDTADTAIKASAGAGLRNYITSLTVTNDHATVGTVVEVKDGSTVIHRGYAGPAGGGYTLPFPTPLKGTAATAVNVANITTGSNTYVSMSGYAAP